MLESLSDVRLFVQVMESKGLTAAGRVLRVPTNHISRRLARLERSLAVRLFDRTTRQVMPTPEGRAFYPRALRLLEAAGDAEVGLSQRDPLAGVVRVLVRTTSVELGFVSEVTRLLARHPELTVQLLVRDEPVDLVGEAVDRAGRVGALAETSLHARHVGDAAYGLAAARGYGAWHGLPSAPGDLIHHEVLRRHGAPPEQHWALVGPGGQGVTVPIAGRFECNDSRAHAIALDEGLGIALRPAPDVARAVRERRWVRVLPGWRTAPIPVWAVTPPGRLRVPRVALLVDALRQVLKAVSASGAR